MSYSKDSSWEIPFESITSLEYLGSGTQGIVFLGNLRGEMVAVKKVKSVIDTEVKHLKKLNHPNVITVK